jgi:DNA repair protein RadC
MNIKKPHYFGHRQRLRERFEKVGYLGMHDYEILELLLCLCIPRGDVKPIAKDLLNRFKNLETVFHADHKHLLEIEGVGPQTVHFLKIMLATHQRLTQITMHQPNILSNFSKVLDYCYTHMSFERVEEVRILYLNAKMSLIKDEVHQKGTVSESAFYIPEIIKRTLDLGSSGIVVIHNHPSGDPKPSLSNIKMTMDLAKAVQLLNIKLHDHIIIGKSDYYSFNQHNRLPV